MKVRPLLSIAAVLVLLLFPVVVHAAGEPCAPPGSPPACDGVCPPGEECVQDTLGNPLNCICEPTAGYACGDNPTWGVPMCWGYCPPPTVCRVSGSDCVCEPIPTLSEWGIMIFSGLAFGTVLVKSRRRSA
jgi:hypothetical protein